MLAKPFKEPQALHLHSSPIAEPVYQPRAKGVLTTVGLARYQVLPAASPNQVDSRPSYFGGDPTAISPRMMRYTTKMPEHSTWSAAGLCWVSWQFADASAYIHLTPGVVQSHAVPELDEIGIKPAVTSTPEYQTLELETAGNSSNAGPSAQLVICLHRSQMTLPLCHSRMQHPHKRIL